MRLEYNSVWPTFACVVVLYGVAATPLLAFADSPPSFAKNRVVTLDGLRGFLALAVVFHHVAVYHRYMTAGVWDLPATHFYQFLGPLGVSGFFMITGYLFWGRLIRDGGSAGWRSFYLGRLFRISPLYLAAVGSMLVIVFSREHFHLVVPLFQVAKELTRWLSLGLLAGFTADGNPLALVLVAGVTWSIQWEWFFYASLPLMAFVARSERYQLTFLAAVYGGCLACSVLPLPAPWSHQYERLIALFVMGMLSASLEARGVRASLPNVVSSAVLVALVGGVFLLRDPYSFKAGLVLGGMFFLIASGSTVFGLLESRPARRLGDISYGIYLLQGLALGAVFSSSGERRFALATPVQFWLCALAAGGLLLVLATGAHVLIERPGIALGKRLAGRRPARPAVSRG